MSVKTGVQKIVALFRSVPDPATPALNPLYIEQAIDSDGTAFAKLLANVAGNSAKITGFSDASDTASLSFGDYILGIMGFDRQYDEASSVWRRVRCNTSAIVLASAARTATVNSADFSNYNFKGLHLTVNVSSITATPSIVVNLQGKDPISGTYYTLLSSTAITATGLTVLKICPGIAPIVNRATSDILPLTWRVNVTHGDADPITYSIGASLVV